MKRLPWALTHGNCRVVLTAWLLWEDHQVWPFDPVVGGYGTPVARDSIISNSLLLLPEEEEPRKSRKWKKLAP